MKDKFDALVDHLLTGGIFLQQAIEVLEKNMIQGALQRAAGNQSGASKLLGIHRNTLQRKMVQFGLGNGRTHARRKPVASQRRVQARKAGAG